MATTTTAFGRTMTKIFGSRNDRLLKRYRRIVGEVSAMEPKVRELTDEQLKDRVQEIRAALVAGKLRSADVLPEAFAIIREAMDRHIGIRQIFNPDENFDPDKFDDETLALFDSVQRKMLNEGQHWLTVPIPLPIYAAVRKMYPESRPPFRARCFDVQLMGGLVLYEGQDRRDGHRRGQDVRRPAGLLHARPRRVPLPRRHRQRLPGAAGRELDPAGPTSTWG